MPASVNCCIHIQHEGRFGDCTKAYKVSGFPLGAGTITIGQVDRCSLGLGFRCITPLQQCSEPAIRKAPGGEEATMLEFVGFFVFFGNV